MIPETLAALHGSIRKWDRIAAQECADQYPMCAGCPVAARAMANVLRSFLPDSET